MFQESAQSSSSDAAYIPPEKTWIVITDGCRARVFETLGRHAGISPAFASDFYLSCETLGATPSRRTFDPEALSVVRRGGAPAATCPKKAFAAALARALESNLGNRRFDRLVLVAPPQVLGDLSGVFPTALRGRVAAEIQRDLMNVAPYELPAYLGSALPD